MTNKNLQEKKIKFFSSSEKFFKKQSKILINELKKDSSLKEDDVIKILLEFYNRGATQTKLLYPCYMCQNQQNECIACNELVKELDSYK